MNNGDRLQMAAVLLAEKKKDRLKNLFLHAGKVMRVWVCECLCVCELLNECLDSVCLCPVCPCVCVCACVTCGGYVACGNNTIKKLFMLGLKKP